MHIEISPSEEAYREDIDMCSRCYIHGLHFIAHIPIYLTYTIAYLNILRISPEFSAVQCISFFRFGRVSYYAFHTYHTDITMKVIASVEKYENAGMKFSTVPAFALAESRASDACCLFLTLHTLTRSQRVFLPRKVPSKLRILDQIWNCTRGDIASTHELRPVLFPCASCRPPPMQPCCDACFLSPC